MATAICRWRPVLVMRRLTLFFAGATLVAAIEGMVRGGLGAALLCAAAIAGLAIPLGVVAALAALVGRRLDRGRRLERSFARARERWTDLRPLLRAQIGLSVLVFVAVMLIASLAVARRSWTFDDERFAVALIAAGTVLAIAAAAALAALAAAALEIPLRWWQSRRGLPWPKGAVLRLGLWIALPSAALSAYFVYEFRLLLGPLLAALFSLGFYLPTSTAVAMAAPRLPRTGPGRTAAAAVAVAIALFVVAALRYDPRSEAADTVVSAPLPSLGLRLLRGAGDFDRDGASAWFGGGDCEPFDSSVHPRAEELRGNGRDEDCDGIDRPAEDWSWKPIPTFAGVEKPKRYNILWITIDAVRADHTGLHGYRFNTTPHIDALAGESLVFERAYSQSSRTFFSVPSMFTGTIPGAIDWTLAHGVQQPAEKHMPLATVLSRAGYQTTLILPGNMKKSYRGLQRGFSEVLSYFPDARVRRWRREGSPLATYQAMRAIEAAGEAREPFFVAIHYIGPHAPYSRQGEGYPDFSKARSIGYDEEIADVDRNLGMLLRFLRMRDLQWARTIVIVTSDHGEEFGDHGGKYHGRNCHRESVWVPLVVRIPGYAPRRVPVPVGLVDIAPALTELTGVDGAEMSFSGQSLLVALGDDAESDRPLFCSTASAPAESPKLRRAVRTRDHLLSQDVLTGEVLLFDLDNDRREWKNVAGRKDLAGTQEALLRFLSASLEGNLKSVH